MSTNAYDLDALTAAARKCLNTEAMPAELRACAQWVNWRYTHREGQAKPTKAPVVPSTGGWASTTDPGTWGTFEAACLRFNQDPSIAGVGFVFTQGDPFMGIDLDNAVDDAGTMSLLAAGIVDRFRSYTERSISGKGLHIIVKGTLPEGKGRKNPLTGVEAYDRSRFFIMSGQHLGTPTTVESRQDVIDKLLPELFKPRTADPVAMPEPGPGNRDRLTDDELLKRAMESRNGTKFQQLWEGHWQDAGYQSQSEADLALCQSLVFWTNRDPERVDQLFRRSGLMRDKWNREDYRRGVFDIAMQQTEGYEPPAKLESSPFKVPVLTREPTTGTGKVPQLGPDRAQRMVLAAAHHAVLAEKYGPPYVQSGHGITINQVYFAAKFCLDHLILFEPGIGEFYVYNPERGLWIQQTEALIKTQLAADIKDTADATSMMALTMKCTESLLKAIVTLMRGYGEKRDPFSRPGHVIHLQNGMLDLDAKPPVLKPFSPDYYSRNQSPIAYDPAAKCPRFIKNLLEPVLSPEDISLLQRWAGMALMGGNPAQRLMIQTGPGGAGKGSFANIVEGVIGLQNVAQLRTTFLGERFELYGFLDRSFLSGKDVPGNFMNDRGAHVIKTLVGNDVLNGEKKGGDRIQIRGVFNVLITTNNRLRVNLEGDVGAWRRRLLIVPYRSRGPEIKTIPDLDAILLREEGPGIVNWMVEGAVKLLEELDAGGIQLSKAQQDRIDAFLFESDSVREFVRRGIVADESGDITTDEVVKAYTMFCKTRGWNPLPVRVVEVELRDVVLEVHGEAKRNDIKRDGRSHKGYAHLRIVVEEGGT